MRPGTTIVLVVLLLAVFLATAIQLVLVATR
jgi:hypothetical protein